MDIQSAFFYVFSAVLLIAAVNPRPWVALRLLTWTSPAWPLGGWLATGLAVGAGMSAAGTALALQGQPASVRPRRQVRRGATDHEANRESDRELDRAKEVVQRQIGQQIAGENGDRVGQVGELLVGARTRESRGGRVAALVAGVNLERRQHDGLLLTGFVRGRCGQLLSVGAGSSGRD